MPCDTHGDLHLSHVYLFPDRPPPDDLVIIDCVEFAERFRFADPVADIAFLVMDLSLPRPPRPGAGVCGCVLRGRRGRRGPARCCPSTSPTGRWCGRRWKGCRPRSRKSRSSSVEATRFTAAATGCWPWGRSGADPPAGLVLVGGLPGTGKSTLARGSGVGRELHGDPLGRDPQGAGRSAGDRASGRHSTPPEWTERTYVECRRRAVSCHAGRRPGDRGCELCRRGHREMFLSAARKPGCRRYLFVCRADPAVVRERLRARTRGCVGRRRTGVRRDAAARGNRSDEPADPEKRSRSTRRTPTGRWSRPWRLSAAAWLGVAASCQLVDRKLSACGYEKTLDPARVFPPA